MRRYNSYTDHIRKIFGGRVQKVVVNAGFTCPNRDGALGVGGCTFCENRAFNPSYCKPEETITHQIQKGIEFHAARYRRAKKFLIYFQPYSNTYAPLEILKEKYEEALSVPDVAGLVIGTRPDCVNDDTLNYLSELAGRYYIQIEYGVESTNDKTLERINRGHTFLQSQEMISKTHQRGIRTGAHFIFGLPGESPEEMMKMADIISALPIDTVKFHQLQIVKGTRMEEQFRVDSSGFHLFGLSEYLEFIVSFTERLSPSIAIERFTGEVPPRFIEGHNWGFLRNTEILKLIDSVFERRDTYQGRLYDPQPVN